MSDQYKIVMLNHHKDQRSCFDCGEPILNDFLYNYANQNQKAGVSSTHIMESLDDGSIMGYFSLSAASLERKELPETESKRTPKYVERLPVYHLTRLALDEQWKGKKLGEALLLQALIACYQAATIASAMAIVVDAKHAEAKSFYEHYGFVSLPDAGLRLFMPMKKLRALVRPLIS